MKKIYLDYAATTPADERVLRFMKPYYAGRFGNPGSLHSFGQEAISAVDTAREKISRSIGADFREIIFTASATEANNLALRGILAASGKKPRLIVSAVEHESVLETARNLEKSGAEVIYLPVDGRGLVRMADFKKALTPETILVSVMYVNNETGAVQPIPEIARLVREARGQNPYPLLHTDAAQAFYLLDCAPEYLGADLITFSGHKIYAPKGAGALYIRKGIKISPALSGGGQEYGLRSGTENVPAIAGLGRAAELARQEITENSKHITRLRGAFLTGLSAIYPRMRLNGPKDNAPHIANIWLPGRRAEELLTRLDLAGVAVAAGSACKARGTEPSHVLRAMGLPEKRIRESIRVSFGRPAEMAEIRAALRIFRAISAK